MNKKLSCIICDRDLEETNLYNFLNINICSECFTQSINWSYLKENLIIEISLETRIEGCRGKGYLRKLTYKEQRQ